MLKGLYVALVTPFAADGSLNEEKLRELVRELPRETLPLEIEDPAPPARPVEGRVAGPRREARPSRVD